MDGNTPDSVKEINGIHDLSLNDYNYKIIRAQLTKSKPLKVKNRQTTKAKNNFR